jgi:hypothetical protein
MAKIHDLKEYGDEANVRQTPARDPLWQDSVVLVWWDDKNRVGGFHRLGHEPNVPGGGHVSLWNNIVSPVGWYKNDHYKPLRKADLQDNGGFGCGDDTCRFEFLNGEHVWTISDGDVSARLAFRDIGKNVDGFPKKGALSEEFTSAHLDIPGTVSGQVKIKGKEYKVNNAFAIRDHGWGSRDWDVLLAHRWVVGTCGKDLSFITVSFSSTDGKISSFAWVIRDKEVTFADKVDIRTYVEVDGVTNEGGHVRYHLTTGEVIDLEFTPVPDVKPVAVFSHDILWIERFCSFEFKGIKGFANFETTSNVQHGKRPPPALCEAYLENGFHPSA